MSITSTSGLSEVAEPAAEPLETVETVTESRPAAARVRVQPAASLPPEPRRSRTRVLIWWLVLAAFGTLAWYFHPQWWPWVSARISRGAEAPARVGPRAAPVTTAVAEKKDLPVYLTGLGTVTALNTVTVRSRVDGELINVAFTEGQQVKQGDLLAEIDPRPYAALLDQAKGQLARDEATLELSKLNLARTEGLFRAKSVTRQVYDEQVATVKQNEATVRVSKAAVEDAAVRLGYCRITAPIDGRVGLRRVDRGNVVRASDPAGLAVITQLEPIALVFTIPQDDIPRVQKRLQETASPVVEAFDRGFRTRIAEGTLAAIDNQVDPATGTLRLKATFENKDRTLFPNQFVNARLLVDVIRDAVVVPSEAVQRGPESTFVYVVKPDETAELRTVTTGPAEGGVTAILTGLEAGETVVTGGIDKLQPGGKVSLGGGKGAPQGGVEAEGPAERKGPPRADGPRENGPREGAPRAGRTGNGPA